MSERYWALGYELVESSACADMVQAKRHRKKRINKKWRKRYGMKEIPWNKVIIAQGKIIAHPKVMHKIRMELGVSRRKG